MHMFGETDDGELEVLSSESKVKSPVEELKGFGVFFRYFFDGWF